MKEQKKSTSKVIVRSALILLLLTLISGCFLGSTFARYVSKGEGDLSAGVAEWKITETNSGADTAAVKLENFSPNMAEFESGKVRKREMNDVLLFSLKNDGDVQANVYLTLGDETDNADGATTTPTVKAYGYVTGTDEVNKDDVIAFGDSEPDYKPTKTEFAQIITMTPDIRTGTALDNAQTATTSTDTDSKTYYALAPGQTLYVLVDVAWTTDLTGDNTTAITDGYPSEMNIVEADLRDTWIGENVAAVGWEYSWVALQGSELPDGAYSTQESTSP